MENRSIEVQHFLCVAREACERLNLQTRSICPVVECGTPSARLYTVHFVHFFMCIPCPPLVGSESINKADVKGTRMQFCAVLFALTNRVANQRHFQINYRVRLEILRESNRTGCRGARSKVEVKIVPFGSVVITTRTTTANESV